MSLLPASHVLSLGVANGLCEPSERVKLPVPAPSLPAFPQPPLSSVKVLFIRSSKIPQVFLYTLPFSKCLICMYLLFQVGDRDDSNLYINVKLKAAEEVKPRAAMLAS